MKKNLLFIGILILGISMIVSSIILSKSIKKQTQLNGTLNGTLTMNDSYNIDNDILQTYDAGAMLGYNESDLIRDIENGKLEGLPCTKIGGHYIFSKKALEEWIYNKTLN